MLRFAAVFLALSLTLTESTVYRRVGIKDALTNACLSSYPGMEIKSIPLINHYDCKFTDLNLHLQSKRSCNDAVPFLLSYYLTTSEKDKVIQNINPPVKHVRDLKLVLLYAENPEIKKLVMKSPIIYCPKIKNSPSSTNNTQSTTASHEASTVSSNVNTTKPTFSSTLSPKNTTLTSTFLTTDELKIGDYNLTKTDEETEIFSLDQQNSTILTIIILSIMFIMFLLSLVGFCLIYHKRQKLIFMIENDQFNVIASRDHVLFSALRVGQDN